MTTTGDQTVAAPPAKPKCNHCEQGFAPHERFYRCEPCRDGEYNTCLRCLLKDDYTTNGHGPVPCFSDQRDGRATFIPGPSVEDFRVLVTQMKSDPSFKFPIVTMNFFQRGIEIEDFPTEHLQKQDCFEASNEIVAAWERRVEDDYSMYEPLDPIAGEIRMALLVQGRPEDPVSVALVRMKRPWTQREYNALSYCWGPLEETRWIGMAHAARKVGEEENEGMQTQMFRCTANLEIALRALRRRDKFVIFWVDALCINQADLEERAYQVGMMHEIFTNAGAVCVWLGLSNEHTLATTLIRTISEARKRCLDDGSIPADNTELQQAEQLLRNMSLSTSEETLDRLKILKMLSNFFSDPYFRRVWVLQEVCLGKEVFVLAGQDDTVVITPWSAITFADLYITVAFRLFKTSIGGLVEPWKKFERQNRKSDQQIARLPILELFADVSQAFKATDIRDTLFGLLAISHETFDVAELPPMMAPDYTKPPNQIFIDLTKWCILQSQELAVLGYVSYMLRDKEATRPIGMLPSWSLSPYPRYNGIGIKLNNVLEFDTCASQPIDMTLIQNLTDFASSPYLPLRGHRLATIAQANNLHFTSRWDTNNDFYIRNYDTQTYYSGGMRYIFSQLRSGHKPLSDCFTPGSHYQAPNTLNPQCTCRIILDRTLLALTCNGMHEHAGCDHANNIHRTKYLTPTEMYPDFAAHWVSKNKLDLENGDPEMTTFCPHVRDLLLPLAEAGDEDKMSELLLNASRKVFAVTGGMEMGLVPLGTRKDDIVVGLYGGRAPFVLREMADEGETADPIGVEGEAEGEEKVSRAGRRWEFIGECIFPDFVDGKKVRKMIEERKESEVFELW